MGLRSRLKGFIRNDRPAKLKSLLSARETDPCDIVYSRRRNLLHCCAEFGSVDMMRCLLQLECDPMHQDKDGRLPLHTALYRCLGEDFVQANETYNGIVCLLLNVGPISQDVEDKESCTGYDLLKKVKEKLKYGQKSVYSTGEKTQEENEWRAKLARETAYEFEEQQSRYSHCTEDFSDVETAQDEDFGNWSDRIHREYVKKMYGKNSIHSSSNPRKRGYRSSTKCEESGESKKSKSKLDPDEELKKAREEMRKNYKPPPVKNLRQEQLLSQKLRYEKRFVQFFSHPPAHGSVSFGSIPWPCTNMDKLTDTLFCDLTDNDNSSYKKFLRKEQVRWHPDKFLQKFKDYLHPDHTDKIMARVKTISQTLNGLAE